MQPKVYKYIEKKNPQIIQQTMLRKKKKIKMLLLSNTIWGEIVILDIP